MTTNNAGAPALASAALMLREDDHVLLVRHAEGTDGAGAPFAGSWTPPMALVGPTEAAEDALARILSGQLHVGPGPFEFNDTLYLESERGTRYIVNAFLCVDWEGEPRVSPRDYSDAAWVAPAAMPDLEGGLAPGLAEWFARSFALSEEDAGPEMLMAVLSAARRELIDAFNTLPVELHHEALDEGWTPADVLAHAADLEAYVLAESRILLETPGHTWRSFNAAQWEITRRLRGEDADEDVLVLQQRLAETAAASINWLGSLTAAELQQYGNHRDRGAVRIAERIERIANHDREHAEQLRTMARTARLMHTSG